LFEMHPSRLKAKTPLSRAATTSWVLDRFAVKEWNASRMVRIE
jgi:hypothetical protein